MGLGITCSGKAATGRPVDPLALEDHMPRRRSRMSEYDTDILGWSEHQAALLRRRAAGELANDEGLDWLNLAEDSPSLRPFAMRVLPAAFANGRQAAERETGLLHVTDVCPWSLEQIISIDFLPD